MKLHQFLFHRRKRFVGKFTLLCTLLQISMYSCTAVPDHLSPAKLSVNSNQISSNLNPIQTLQENVGREVPEKCTKLYLQPDPCQYVKLHCSDLSEGFIDFLEIYYCHLHPHLHPIFSITTMLSILASMFLFLGTVASDFFCPNLATVAQTLQLSESVAGVTLLAFGNGSPDLFSTFASLKAGSGALAMGELIGAAWFVTSVVVGTMAVVKSFQVTKKLFLRDLWFFMGAVVWMIVIVWDQKLTRGEALGLVMYYLAYVVTVVGMNYFSLKQSMVTSDPLLRAKSYQGTFPHPNPTFFDVLEEDAELEGLLMSNLERVQVPEESTRLISQLHHTNSPTDLSPLSYHSTDATLEQVPLVTPITYYKKLSFWTVDEITRALNHGQDNLAITPRQRRRTEFLPVSAKLSSRVLGSSSFTESPPMRPIRTYSDSSIANPPSTPRLKFSNSAASPTANSPTRVHFDFPNFKTTLIPSTPIPSTPHTPPTHFQRANKPTSIQIPPPSQHQPESLLPAPNQVTTNENRVDLPATIRTNSTSNVPLPITMEPQDSTTSLDFPPTPTYQRTALWQLLFPGLCDWNQLTSFEKVFNLVSLPAILVLTLTVPTPAYDEDLSLEGTVEDLVGVPRIIVNSPVPLPRSSPMGLPLLTPPHSAASLTTPWFKGMLGDDAFTANLILSTLQAFTIPIFLFETVLVSNDWASRPDIVYAVLLGSILALALSSLQLATRKYRTELPHPTKLVKSLLGFAQSICWISMTANEVVDLLRALGVIFDVDEEIIGLTVFAVGNSLGDLVANFAVARMGYPMMAVSACFAGPMLNMMLGPGLAGTYLGFTRGEPIPLPVSNTMLHSGFLVLGTLIVYNIYLQCNQFRIGKKFGLSLIGFYFLAMGYNVLKTTFKWN